MRKNLREQIVKYEQQVQNQYLQSTTIKRIRFIKGYYEMAQYEFDIYKFFTPQFNTDLLITILSFLEIEEILLIQSLIRDIEIQRLSIPQITNKKLKVELHNFDENNDLELEETTESEFDTEDDDEDNPDHQQARLRRERRYRLREHHTDLETAHAMIDNIIELTTNNSKTIPIVFDLTYSNGIPIDCLERVLRGATNFDLELNFGHAMLETCQRLDDYCHSKLVSSLKIENVYVLGSSGSLNFGNYPNLKELELFSYDLTNLVLSPNLVHTLTRLCIDDIFDMDYLCQFEALRYLEIHTKRDSHIMIKDLPREITSLKLECRNGGRIFIDSSEDWPQYLQSIKLWNIEHSFGDVQDYKLPSLLKELSVIGEHIHNILNQLPDTLTALILRFKRQSGSIDGHNFVLSRRLQKLSLYDIDLEIIGVNHIVFPSTLMEFGVNNCNISIPLNNINFENSKSSLKILRINQWNKNLIPLEDLNFSKFTRLTTIILSYCNISSLADFQPSYCLKLLEINHNPITSIDEECLLFKNPFNYPYLSSLEFNHCQINNISPGIRFPINLLVLRINDTTQKEFTFTPAIVHHKALQTMYLYGLTSINFMDSDIIRSKSKLSVLRIKFAENFLPTSRAWFNNFYDMLERYLNRSLQDRPYGISSDGDIILLFWR